MYSMISFLISKESPIELISKKKPLPATFDEKILVMRVCNSHARVEESAKAALYTMPMSKIFISWRDLHSR